MAGTAYESRVRWFTGFEVGNPVRNFFDGYDAGHGSGFTGYPTTDALQVQSSIVRHGAYALRCHQTGTNGQAYWGWDDPEGGQTLDDGETWIVVASVGVYIDTPMAGRQTEILVFPYQSSSAINPHIYVADEGDGYRFYAVIGAGDPVEGPAVEFPDEPLWYQLDARCTITDNDDDTADQRLEWMVNGVAQEDATFVGAFERVNGVLVGPGYSGDTHACDLYFDDFAVGVEFGVLDPATWDTYSQADEYPYGELSIVKLAIDGVSTHNNPTHFQEEDGTAIDANTWNKLDEWPPTGAADPDTGWDGIKQVTLNSASYLGFTFEDMSGDEAGFEILGVRPCAVVHASGSGSSKIALHSVTGSDEDYVNGGSSFPTGLLTVGFGPNDVGQALRNPVTWDVAKVNALVIRVGYSTDVTPNPKLDALRLEVATVVPPPPIPRVAGSEESNAGTPAHVVAQRKGGDSAYPLIANWEANEQIDGGWIGATGRITEAEYREDPQTYDDGNIWLTTIRETGDPIFQGRLRRPAINGGAVDLSADGPAIRMSRQFERLLFRKDGFDGWVTQDDEPHEVHDPPGDELTIKEVTDGEAGGLTGDNVDNYKYAVTFVTAESESGLGPATEVQILVAGGPHHVKLRDIPTGGRAVTARKLYRKDPGQPWALLDTLADNTTGAYEDSTAEGGLGAAPPRAVDASAIEVDVKDSVAKFTVPADGYIYADQRAGIVGWYVGAHCRRVRVVISKNRALPNWEIRLATSEGPSGAWDTATPWTSLDGEESQIIDVHPDNEDDDRLRFQMRRTSEGADTEDVAITLRRLKVYDIAPDDDFSISDMMRVLFTRANLEPSITEHQLVALPSDWEAGTYADVASWLTLLSGWPWIAEVRNSQAMGIFRPPRRRVFTLIDPEAPRDLLPIPPRNRVRLRYRRSAKSRQWHHVIRTADPNPLENIHVANISIDVPLSDMAASYLAQRLVDQMAQDRRTGSLTFDRLQLNGEWVRGHECRVGDAIYIPSENLVCALESLSRHEAYVVVELPEKIPLLDRFTARHQIGDS